MTLILIQGRKEQESTTSVLDTSQSSQSIWRELVCCWYLLVWLTSHFTFFSFLISFKWHSRGKKPRQGDLLKNGLLLSHVLMLTGQSLSKEQQSTGVMMRSGDAWQISRTLHMGMHHRVWMRVGDGREGGGGRGGGLQSVYHWDPLKAKDLVSDGLNQTCWQDMQNQLESLHYSADLQLLYKLMLATSPANRTTEQESCSATRCKDKRHLCANPIRYISPTAWRLSMDGWLVIGFSNQPAGMVTASLRLVGLEVKASTLGAADL